MKRVALDLDGVCFDWDSSARRLLRDVYGEDPGPGPSRYWDHIRLRVSKDAWRWLWNEGIDAGLFRGPPVAGAEPAIRSLQTVCDLVPLTSRPQSARTATEAFCLMLGLPEPVMVGSMAEKAEHDFDLYIDDSPEAIRALFWKVKPAIVFDQPWNQDIGYVDDRRFIWRAHSWAEVVDLVRDVCSREGTELWAKSGS